MERSEKMERSAKSEKMVKTEKTEKTEKIEKIDKTEKTEKTEKPKVQYTPRKKETIAVVGSLFDGDEKQKDNKSTENLKKGETEKKEEEKEDPHITEDFLDQLEEDSIIVNNNEENRNEDLYEDVPDSLIDELMDDVVVDSARGNDVDDEEDLLEEEFDDLDGLLGNDDVDELYKDYAGLDLDNLLG